MRRSPLTAHATAALFLGALVTLAPARLRADATTTAKPAATCKAHGGACCDSALVAHLQKEAIFAACGQSEATYLGEAAAKDTCTYTFNIPGEKQSETIVQVYAPAQKDVPSQPNDPFFRWKKVGKSFVTDKALSPKSAPMLASATGIWLPGKDHFVSVRVSTKVCTKPQALKLATKVK